MKSLQGFNKVVLVVATLDNGGIGLDSALPWHIPEELKLFKDLTMGCTLVVGSHTFNSLPNLPGRCVLNVKGKLPKQYLLCGGGVTYTSLYKQGMEMVVSIIRNDNYAVNKFLSQDIQSDIRWLISTKKLLPIAVNTRFTTFATSGVREFIMSNLQT